MNSSIRIERGAYILNRGIEMGQGKELNHMTIKGTVSHLEWPLV